jgi:predicted SAM-dependent methyltransferase
MSLSPVVLFAYNRPNHTRQTVEALQKNHLAQESQLFIYSDAPKNQAAKEHVIEHIEYEEFVFFLKVVKLFMKINGVIRIAVPDGNHPSKYIRDLVGVNGQEPGADDHKYFYKIGNMENIANHLGYKLEKLEYFDDDGVFHHNTYNENYGFISRNAKNYTGRFTNNSTEYKKFIDSTPLDLQEQFLKNNFSYTSLIVDFIKVS